jgi:hypothetical protein
MIIAPIFTMDRLIEEPNKRLMTIYTIILNNVIVLLLIGFITYHRLPTLDSYTSDSIYAIKVSVMTSLIFLNIWWLVVCSAHRMSPGSSVSDWWKNSSLIYGYIQFTIYLIFCIFVAIGFHIYLVSTTTITKYRFDISINPAPLLIASALFILWLIAIRFKTKKGIIKEIFGYFLSYIIFSFMIFPLNLIALGMIYLVFSWIL